DARQSGKLQVPALEKAKDKQPCPTSRDYSLVPNYQSMNSGARYLVTSDGTTAQDTAQNMAALPNASKQFSGSQEGQFRGAVNHALGCNEWRATDLADPTHMVDSIALNELQAAADQGSSAALTPYNAPFVMSGRKPDLAKLNAYRTALDQPTVATLDQADPHDYCQNLLSQGLPRIVLDKKLTVGQASPLPTAASNLYNLEALRFHNAYSELGCTKQLENVNPITLKMEKNLVVGVDITLNPRSTAKRPPALMPTPNDQNVNQQNPVAPPPEQGPWSGWRSGVRGGGQGGVVPAVPNVNGIIGSIFGGGGGGSGGGWIPSTGNYSNSSWGGTSTSTAGQAFPGQSISSAGQGIPGRSGSARPGW
ncbi:MAG: hypothetical protein ACREP9_01220, partial [Candidatus Dormibacteraceae bacterium]